MTKKEMVSYLRAEYFEQKQKMDDMRKEYNKMEHMDRIGFCLKLSKQEDIYYHFFVVCNDLGVIASNE